MTEQEFRNEMHRYIDSEYDNFLSYKSDLFDIFKEFDRICRKHSLRYFLVFGTLIGAVRDKGFIPWDSDIDVCMPIDDIMKLHGIINDELKDEYYFDSNFVSRNFLYCESRIGIKNKPMSYIHFDIFYAIGAPKTDIEKYRNRLAKLYNDRVIKKRAKYSQYTPIYTHLRYKLHKIIWNLKSLFHFESQIDKRLFSMMHKYDYETSEKIIVISEYCRAYDKNVIEPLKSTNLNGIDVYVPNKAEVMLNMTYKNYLEYLPIDHRFHEFYDFNRTCKILDGTEAVIDYYQPKN